MNTFIYIALAVVVIIALVLSVLLILRADEASGLRKFFGDARKIISSDATSFDNKAEAKDETLSGLVHDFSKDADAWYLKVVSGDKTIADGYFSPLFFDISANAECEKHYVIGTATDCDLHINALEIPLSGALAYIRYDRKNDAFFLWDCNATYDLYLDNTLENSLANGNIAISDGLVLYFPTGDFIKFTSVRSTEAKND